MFLLTITSSISLIVALISYNIAQQANARAKAAERPQAQRKAPSLAPAPQGSPASEGQKKDIKRLFKRLNYKEEDCRIYLHDLNVNWGSMTDVEAAAVISDLETECMNQGVQA